MKVWNSHDLKAAGIMSVDIPIGDIYISPPEALLRMDEKHGGKYWHTLTASHLAHLLRDILLMTEAMDEDLEYVRESLGVEEGVEL